MIAVSFNKGDMEVVVLIGLGVVIVFLVMIILALIRDRMRGDDEFKGWL
jgi:hypothetical protein